MTSSDPEAPAQPATPPERMPLTARLVFTGIGSIILGVLAGVIWRFSVALPAYTVQADGSAAVSERALTQFFASDAVFVIMGAVAGIVIGVATWLLFRGVGWPVAFIAAAGGLIAGIVCWRLGSFLGPGPFAERLAAARPQDQVTIGLDVHAVSTLAVWAFVAVAPVLLGSALGPDEEAPRPVRRRRSAEPDASDQVDDRGVLTPVVGGDSAG